MPDAKSSLSTRPTRNPRVTASRATPQPVAPPPITRMSRGSAELAPARAALWTARGGTAALGSLILRRMNSRAGPPPLSLLEADGVREVYTVAEAVAVAVAMAARRRRRMPVAILSGGDRWRSGGRVTHTVVGRGRAALGIGILADLLLKFTQIASLACLGQFRLVPPSLPSEEKNIALS